MRSWVIRGGHRLVDAVLGVPTGFVLNSAAGSGRELDDVLSGVRQFLGTTIDYTKLRESEAFQRLRDVAGALHHQMPPAPPDAARAWWINLYDNNSITWSWILT